MADPIDLDEIFSPYALGQPKERMKGRDNSNVIDIVKDAFKEGKGGYLLGGAGVLTAGAGVRMAWNKSVKSNLALVQEAAKAEANAMTEATGAGYKARPVTLNRPLTGVVSGATTSGAGLPVAEAEQLALAKDITRSKWLRPFGLGQYADSALTPKLEIRPTIVRPALAGERTLGLTGMTETNTPRPFVVSAKDVPNIVAGGTTDSTGRAIAANMPAPREGLPYNAWQKSGRALVNMHYGNAGIPLNSASNIGKSLFKSGAGLQAIMEAGTAAYDTWPEFLGGSGNNVYGRTVEELRSGLKPEQDPFAYNVVAPFGGVLANAKRWGYGAANAGLAGIPMMYNIIQDARELDEKTQASLEKSFAEKPEQFNPDELERQRLRRIELGVASAYDEVRLNTPEAHQKYKEKLKELEEKKKSKK